MWLQAGVVPKYVNCLHDCDRLGARSVDIFLGCSVWVVVSDVATMSDLFEEFGQ